MSALPGNEDAEGEKAPGQATATRGGHPVENDSGLVIDTPASDASIHEPLGDEKSRRSSHSGDVPEVYHSGKRGGRGATADDQESREEPAAAALSRATSARSHAVTIVPVARRRGLLARLAFVVPEVERPYEYSNKSKWAITAIVALAASASPLGSSIFYPALGQMAVDLNTTPTITNLAVAFYMLSMSIFPLWWSSFSETLGRRTIYVISFALFVVFSILSAVSTNIAMLIVMRVLGGGASASVQAVGAGTIADIWETKDRGRAMGIFYLGPLLGPLLAPIFGGALSQKWGWQSTMWFLAIYGGMVWLMIIFCLPETLARKKPAVEPETTAGLQRMSTRQSVSRHTKATGRILKRVFVDPLSVLLYLRFAPIAVTVMYAAITFGALFILNISIQSTFSKPPYSYPELVVGLLYLPSSVGYIAGSLVGGRWIDRIMAREARRAGRFDESGRLILLPEDRMRENAWLAAVMFPVALIWFGWTAAFGVHVAAPSVANMFFGFGSMLVFGAATTMLTEFMPSRSSAGVAINNFVRNIFSCVGTIVAQPLLNIMGVGWLCTMIGILALVLGLGSVWSLGRFSTKWRIEMDKKLKQGGS